MRGLLLDSGDTLIHPKGDRWNPRFDFEDVLTRHAPHIGAGALPAAFAAGDVYLPDWSQHAAAGYKVARGGYHRVILEALSVEPTTLLLEELDRPLPFSDIVEPFADTRDALMRFRADGWVIAIVADTGRGMRDVYDNNELTDLVDTFVISEELGCSKPDARMYHAASSRLGLWPRECVFVDNDVDNVLGAIALGYGGIGISRYGEPNDDRIPWVRDLAELAAALAVMMGP